jgi:hypothetical protein
MHKDLALTIAAYQTCNERGISFTLVFKHTTNLVKDGFPFNKALGLAMREQGVS